MLLWKSSSKNCKHLASIVLRWRPFRSYSSIARQRLTVWEKELAPKSTFTDHNEAIVASAGGNPIDLSKVKTQRVDSEVTFLKFDDSLLAKKVFWHSSAHLLGYAIEHFYGDKVKVELCDGPGLDDGFFYDVYLSGQTVSEDDLHELSGVATSLAIKGHLFEQLEVSKEVAREMFSYNRFKLHFIDQIPDDCSISLYKCGDFIDLCQGPHIPNTNHVKAIKFYKVSGVHWQGSTEAYLQRIYGISFPSLSQLKVWSKQREEAEKRDHRVIGKKQQLYMTHPDSPGSAFILPHGARIYTALKDFLKAYYGQNGYEEVFTPLVFKQTLWETSGHWEHYTSDMFMVDGSSGSETAAKEIKSALKPMNCPAHCLIFQHQQRSYRDLPIRLAEFSPLHRNETTGALSGLTRVRQFHQDDAHIFCSDEQVPSEVRSCLDLVDRLYKAFGFSYELRLSTRPKDYMGSLDKWNTAESQLKECLNDFAEQWEINPGDGAFYGPKIDVTVTDTLGRCHQTATIQLDFQLPERFKLQYTGADGEMHSPVMIHRAILGSFERMLGILTEHYAGKWPLWLSPRQCMVLPVHNELNNYAQSVCKTLVETGFYADVDISNLRLNKKIREAQQRSYNYIVVVGQQEREVGFVSVRGRDGKQESVDLKEFCKRLIADKCSLL
eukprot:m.81867 g.81867  ORF g.81867 m.81867 type:complete len:665 (+) comp36266_c0_seq9:28-2022(+)